MIRFQVIAYPDCGLSSDYHSLPIFFLEIDVDLCARTLSAGELGGDILQAVSQREDIPSRSEKKVGNSSKFQAREKIGCLIY